VRGTKRHVTSASARDAGVLIGSRLRLISASIAAISTGIAVLAVGYALGLPAAPSRVAVSETVQPQDFDRQDFDPWDTATFAGGRDPSAEDFSIAPPRRSFADRFEGAFDWLSRRRTPQPDEQANNVPPPSPDPSGPAGRSHVASQSARDPKAVPAPAPANGAKKQLRVAEAGDDSTSPSDAKPSDAKPSDAKPSDESNSTAIYDIAAHTVYLPNGQRLEAHSGLGGYLDDPRYVSEKDRGPTPPNIYNLTMRESLFHGVRAVRLVPAGGGNMFGRDGMLAHTYMLGPNGQSNGCVSFKDYTAFLNAFQSGEVKRLIVVERLSTKPKAQTAMGWVPETIKALFGRT
jgi:Protein of unknown function (DUF2778)